jgi:hypothetical protein
MEEAKKEGRVKIAFYVPDYIFWKISKRIGNGNVNALMKIFAVQFAKGKAGLEIDFELSPEEAKKTVGNDSL